MKKIAAIACYSNPDKRDYSPKSVMSSGTIFSEWKRDSGCQ